MNALYSDATRRGSQFLTDVTNGHQDNPIDALRVGFGSHPKKTVLNSSKLDACMAVRCN